jgi:hypothetical protein
MTDQLRSQPRKDHMQSSPATEQDYLEDNIATVAFHLGQPGARLSVTHNGPGLIVEPGEVLKEISRRLEALPNAAARASTPDEAIEAMAKCDYWNGRKALGDIGAVAQPTGMREALERIAKQRQTDEMCAAAVDAADFENAYDIIIGIARAALSHRHSHRQRASNG